MQFNSEANNQDLVSVVNDLTGMDNNVYPLAQKTRDMNVANKQIWQWIHEAYGGWLYDDSNNTTDFPTATANLVSGQRDYTLPSDALTVKGIEVKTTGGIWQELIPVTEEYIKEFISEKQFMSTAAQPAYYTAYSNSVKIYPAANYSQTASIRISYDRGATNFVPSDTTKTPGFASQFHEAVATGGAVRFAGYKQIPQYASILRDWQNWEKQIKDYYNARWADMFPNRITVRDAVREAQ